MHSAYYSATNWLNNKQRKEKSYEENFIIVAFGYCTDSFCFGMPGREDLHRNL